MKNALVMFGWWGVSLLLGPSGFAQSATFEAARFTVMEPSSEFGRLVAAEMTGDLVPDAISHRNGTLLFLFGPGQYSSSLSIPLAANDFAVLEGGAPTGTDSLVVANDDGLFHLWFDWDASLSSSPTSTVIADYFLYEEISSTGLSNGITRLVATRRFETYEVVGYKPGAGLSKIENVLGNAITTALPTTSTVIDFALVDWDGVPRPDVAYLATDRIEVVSLDGALLYYQEASLVTGSVAAFRQNAGTAPSRLVAVLVAAGSNNHLLHVMDAAFQYETPIDLGQTGVQGIAAADFTGEGDDDLVLTSEASTDPVVFINRGVPGDTFSWLSAQLVDAGLGGSPALGQTGRPAVADFDLDGDHDLLVGIDAFDQMVMLPSALADDDSQKLLVPYVESEDETTWAPGGEYQWVAGDPLQTSTGTLELDLELPTDPIPNPTHLELVVWRQPSLDDAVEQVAHFTDEIPWSEIEASQTLTVPIDGEVDVVTDTVFWLEWRLVQKSGSNLSLAGPRTLYKFSTLLAVTETHFDEAISVPIVLPADVGVDRAGGSGITPLDDPGEYDDNPPKGATAPPN